VEETWYAIDNFFQQPRSAPRQKHKMVILSPLVGLLAL